MHTLFLGGNRMTLDNKRQVFIYLAEKHDNAWLQEYTYPRIPEGKKTKPYTLDKDIDYVIQIRNILTHLYFDAKHSDNDTLQFIKFNNERHKTPIDDKMFITVQLVMQKILLHILKKLSFLKGTLSSPFISKFESHVYNED